MIRHNAILAALVVALLPASPALAGLSTKCKPLGLFGGYRQHDLGDRKFQISVLGNGPAGQGFLRDCLLERAGAIAAENGYSRFAIVSFKGSWTVMRSGGAYLNGNIKTVIKLLGPGETAEPVKIDRVVYFDARTLSPERPRLAPPAYRIAPAVTSPGVTAVDSAPPVYRRPSVSTSAGLMAVDPALNRAYPREAAQE